MSKTWMNESNTGNKAGRGNGSSDEPENFN